MVGPAVAEGVDGAVTAIRNDGNGERGTGNGERGTAPSSAVIDVDAESDMIGHDRPPVRIRCPHTCRFAALGRTIY